jgi:hypothetical protein
VSLFPISESDDFVVHYDPMRGMYRVTVFNDGHFWDEYWFDAYEEKEYFTRCRDCVLKHYSSSDNLLCDIFDKIMPENGFCCFADNGK